MKVIICPGVHKTQLTDRFLNNLWVAKQPKIVTTKVDDWLVFPTDKYPAYSSFDLYQWLDRYRVLTDELLFICFSAGVVAGIGAAISLQLRGIKIKAFVAMDGWGVPLKASFPIYRFSHDYFTHWSSALLGTGKASFYSEPAVPHLTLWESPQMCHGWIVKQGIDNRKVSKVKSSAKDYLQAILRDNY